MKAYAYVRASADGRVKDDEFDRQIKTIADFSGHTGYSIEKVFSEPGSEDFGGPNRAVFKKMITAMRFNGVKTIIVAALDQLAGESSIQEQLLIYLASQEITVVDAGSGGNVMESMTRDPLCRAMIKMHDVFEELDRALMVTRLRAAREKVRAENGKCEGRKSYQENYPEILKEMRRLRRRRKGMVRLTYRKIAEELNQQGFSATNGAPFNDNCVRGVLYRAKKRKPALKPVLNEAV